MNVRLCFEKLETEIPQEFILTGDGSSPAVLEKAGYSKSPGAWRR